MSFPVRYVSACLVVLLFGCAEKSAPPAPNSALARPVLTLNAGAGRVLIPPAVIVERGGVPGVFVLTPQAQARFRMIRSGKIINGQVEILSGLDGNETLVAGELHDVHDGRMIKNMLAADAHR